MSDIRTYLNPRRRAMVIALIAVILVTLPAAVLLVRLYRGLALAQARLGTDVVVVPEITALDARGIILSGRPSRHTLTARAFERAETVEGVAKASPQLFLRPAPFTCCGRDDVLLVAVDPATDFTIGPWVEKDRLLTLTSDRIIVGGDIPVMAGDTILFFGTAFQVAAIMERTGDSVVDRSVFMTIAAARAMAEASKTRSQQPLTIARDAYSAVLVEVEKGQTPERVALHLEHAIPGVRAEVAAGPARSVKHRLDALKQGVIILISVLWLSCLLLIALVLRLIRARSGSETRLPV